MLSLNWLWVTLFEHRLEQVCPHAFADNWSYHTSHPGSHHPALQLFVDFTNSLRLEIDWDKTWGWATDQSHAAALQLCAHHILPAGLTLELVPHARELGYILHYRKRQHRAPQNVRHQATLSRLRKLAHHDLPIPAKAHIIQAACNTKALFGVHTYYAGAKYFQDLRTAITRCLVGNHGNSQPHLASMTLDSTLVDPELEVILQSIKAARGFVLCEPVSDGREFLKLAARFLGRELAATGPATALSLYLSKLGWQLTPAGTLIIPGSPDLHLTQTNWPVLKAQAIDSWMDHISVQLTNRKGLRGVPAIDRASTLHSFQAMPEPAHATLSIAIVGGFMLNTQKSHFEAHEGGCELCGQEDTYAHRTLDCPMTEAVRQQHEHDPVHVQLPVMYRPAELDLIKHVRRAFPEPSLKLPDEFVPQYVYTDGSCHQGADPATSYATFAAVCPIVAADQLLQWSHLPAGEFLHRGYATLGVGHVTGEANIPRAELQIAVMIHELGIETVVVTDSAYVISVHDKVTTLPSVLHLHLDPNFDLIQRWHAVCWTHQKSTPVLKVKAHADYLQGPTEQRMHRMGNAAADEAAKQAAKHLVPEYVHMLKQLHQQRTEERSMLQQHYALLYDLALHRIQLSSPDCQVPNQADPQNFLQQLIDWNPTNTRRYSLDEAIDFTSGLHCSHWGTIFSDLVLQWLASLEWPQDFQSFHGGAPPIGVSWVELTINFWLLTQRSPLVNLATGGPADWKDPLTLTEYDLHQFNFTSLIRSLQRCVTFLESLFHQRLMPHERQKVTSLHWLGLRGFRTGVPYRPRMQLQTTTMKIVADYLESLQERGDTGCSSMPMIPEQEPTIVSHLEEPPGDTQAQRQARLRHWRSCQRATTTD
eukprot:Skav229650  [mRNA]  locus=scaffold649:387537:390158:- [translate_table: standard]